MPDDGDDLARNGRTGIPVGKQDDLAGLIDRAEVGRVNTFASGQSYMPAVVIPIPIIAPVQGTACDGIGDQLLEFLSGKY